MTPEPFTLPKSVLIVDDDQNLRRSLSLMLRRAGYLAAACGQACEALQQLQSGSYNLIIMDITSPENRLTLLPAILCMYPHLSVLVFTALWSPETALEIGRLGVQAHLEKPVTPGQLLDCVEVILAKQA
jgi:two-component system phosphoglycerate transport system response regulator PgtA